MKKTKKKIKVRDMKPKKDTKGGSIKQQGAAPTRTFMQGTGKPAVN